MVSLHTSSPNSWQVASEQKIQWFYVYKSALCFPLNIKLDEVSFKQQFLLDFQKNMGLGFWINNQFKILFKGW